MAVCCSQMMKFRPIELQEQNKQIVAVYLGSAVFSLVIGAVNDWVGSPLPAIVNAQRGLACMPMEYNLPSTLFMWLFTINLMLVGASAWRMIDFLFLV